MKLRIFAAVLLIAAIAGALWGAWILHGEYTQARDRYDTAAGQLSELDEKAAKLQKELDGLTLDAAQARQEEADTLRQEAEQLTIQLDALKAEIETMKTYLEENQDAVAEAQAELTYLQGVYDALEEGLAKVEGYLAGN